ncbi:MAG: ribonuclease J [Dehalococcoidia bacterium]|nr:ribonuclease J [Dehalococcoidia bacterium]MQG15522.1 ribonuclease J [SAR202 cluster bacterium]
MSNFSKIKIIPLGGLGEIGRNMMVIELDEEIIVIDAGILFPSSDMPGVDFIIADINYLIKNQDRVQAILLTHGHEDHIGALPYVLSELNVPVYASRLTHSLITMKLREHGLLQQSNLQVIQPNELLKIGGFDIEFFRVCHSIPDSMGIAIHTPYGAIVHTGDFKIDHTPIDKHKMDFATLSRLAAEGVLVLLADSTYAEVDGYTPSESTIQSPIDLKISQAPGRIIVATFASLISRMQIVLDSAHRHDRKVAVVGRSMSNNLKMAIKMGYLNVEPNILISLKEAKKLPDSKTILLATGTQGEPTSALVRMSRNEHKDVKIVSGDTVILSSSPIPGNESLVAKTIDDLYRLGAKVFSSRNAEVHVHGHASREELKLLLNVVQPKFYIPIHGEYRHLVANTELAQSVGIEPQNTLVLENGYVVEIDAKQANITSYIPLEQIFISGQKPWHNSDFQLNQRSRISKSGIVVVGLNIKEKPLALSNEPTIISYGFPELNKIEALSEKTSQVVHFTLENNSDSVIDWYKIRENITTVVADMLYKETKRRPVVLILVQSAG